MASNKAAAAAAAAAARNAKKPKSSSTMQIVAALCAVAIAALVGARMMGSTPAPEAATHPAPPKPQKMSGTMEPPLPFRVLPLGPSHPNTPPGFRDVYPVLVSVRDNPDLEVTVLNEEPLILQIEDFLTAEECVHFIELMKRSGLARSTVVGGMTGQSFRREYSEVRTSSNTWCMGECFDDPVTVNVSRRIALLLHQKSRDYAEHLQMLEYTTGQFYKQHNDYIDSQKTFGGGSRLYTFFMYLTDVDLGGETEFVNLGIAVKPKRGRAVLWPNVRYNPPRDMSDDRTDHQAKPVLSTTDIKYAINSWQHLGDFQTPFARGEAP
eukprot:Amastigsp_a841495_34.p1 type:complete len:323 gc:universal Amastigsp_a841495_34:1000-32(-)